MKGRGDRAGGPGGFGALAMAGDGLAAAGPVGGGLNVGDAGLSWGGFFGLGVGGGAEGVDGAGGFLWLAGVVVGLVLGIAVGLVLGGVGRGLGTLALEHGEENVGEAGAAGVLGFGFSGDGGLFEFEEDAEELGFSGEEGVDEGVGDGFLTGAGAVEDGLGEAVVIESAGGGAGGGGLEIVVVGGVGGGDGVVDAVEARVGHGFSWEKKTGAQGKRDADGRPVGCGVWGS